VSDTNYPYCRFIQEDPIGLFGGINLHTYTFNNPVNLTDPDGELVLEAVIVVIGGIAIITIGGIIVQAIELNNQLKEVDRIRKIQIDARKNAKTLRDKISVVETERDRIKPGLKALECAADIAIKVPGTSANPPF